MAVDPILEHSWRFAALQVHLYNDSGGVAAEN